MTDDRSEHFVYRCCYDRTKYLNRLLMLHRRIIPLVLSLSVLSAAILSACGEDVWDQLPAGVSQFLAQYFPGVGISSYSSSSAAYSVELRNDASLRFGSDLKWTEIDGNGSPLPQDLIYDQMPEAVYTYLEQGELTSGVFAVRRDAECYLITLHDSLIRYDIATRKITSVTDQDTDS